MTKEKYFVYALLDPITLEIRYVGQTDNPKRRYKEHLQDALKGKIFWTHNWLRSCLSKGLRIPMLILQDDAIKNVDEAKWIDLCIKNGCTLTNTRNNVEIHRHATRKRQCEYCNCSYITDKGNKVYCSDQCRFMSKVNYTEEDKFWEWQGNKVQNKFPNFHLNGHKSSKVACWELFVRDPIPDDKWIVQKCDNILCVNPDHLEISNTPQTKSGHERTWAKRKQVSQSDREFILQNYKFRDPIFGRNALAIKFSLSKVTISKILSQAKMV